MQRPRPDRAVAPPAGRSRRAGAERGTPRSGTGSPRTGLQAGQPADGTPAPRDGQPGTLAAFQARHAISMEAMCRRIFESNRETIQVQGEAVATANLGRIMESTLRLANRTGFHSMSLRQLARDSGLSMGALYAYFDSKETLLLMILDAVSHAVVEVLGKPPAEVADDPVARLRWLLGYHLYVTELLHPWCRFAYLEAKSFPQAGRDRATRSELATEAMVADVLADGVRRGVFRSDDIELRAAMIKPMLQDWYVKRSKYRRRGITVEQYARALIALVEDAIWVRLAQS